jgi:hypothetical protein
MLLVVIWMFVNKCSSVVSYCVMTMNLPIFDSNVLESIVPSSPTLTKTLSLPVSTPANRFPPLK